MRPPRCTGRGRPSGRRVQQKRRWVVAQFAELQPPPVPERDASRICTTRCMVMLHAGWAPLPTARPPISLSLVTLLPERTSKVFGKGRSTLDHLFHRAEAATSSSTSTAGGNMAARQFAIPIGGATVAEPLGTCYRCPWCVQTCREARESTYIGRRSIGMWLACACCLNA